jgi:flagellum-specific ATP synthase
MSESISLEPYLAQMERIPAMAWTGEITQVVGLLIESRGPNVAIGDFCEVAASNGRRIRTQVIGFREGRVLSMPLEETDGLQLGDPIAARPEEARVEVAAGTASFQETMTRMQDLALRLSAASAPGAAQQPMKVK